MEKFLRKFSGNLEMQLFQKKYRKIYKTTIQKIVLFSIYYKKIFQTIDFVIKQKNIRAFEKRNLVTIVLEMMKKVVLNLMERKEKLFRKS